MRIEPAKAHGADDAFGANRLSVVSSPGFHAHGHAALICPPVQLAGGRSPLPFVRLLVTPPGPIMPAEAKG
jgi:hypothetical protein